MKKPVQLLLFLFTLCTVLSCTQDNQTNKDKKMYAQVWDDIINKGETSKINSTYFDENVTLITEPENVVGIDALKSYWDTFLAGFSNREFTVKDIFGQDGNLVKHWHFKGEHTGDFFGIPASGNNIELEGTTLIKMKNGKIAQEQDFFDLTNFMQQLGFNPSQGNIAFINQLYTHFGNGEIPKVLEMMDANIVWNESSCSSYSDNNPYTSPDAVLNGVFGRIGQDNEYFNLENIKLTSLEDDKVLASLNYDGKSKKSGKAYKTTVVHLWTITDGKITAFQQYIGLGKQ